MILSPSLVFLQLSFRWIARAFILFAVVSRFFYLPDVPLLPGDGMTMIELAQSANEQGHLATHGLTSTRGRPHGPTSIWVLQLAYLVTDQLPVIRLLSCWLFTLWMLAGTVLLAKAFKGFCSWEEIATLLIIPDFWFFSRVIWDNSLLIPLSLLMVSSYLCFCRSSNRRYLLLTAIAASLTSGTHLMGLAGVFAIATHFLVWHRGALKNPKWVAAVAVCFFLPLIPYLFGLLNAASLPSSGAGSSRWFAFAWEQLNRGFKVVSIGALPFGLERDRAALSIFNIGEVLAYVFGIYGIFWKAEGRKNSSLHSDFISQVWSLSLLVMGFALGLQILARLNPLLHYFHGCWIAYQLAIFQGWVRAHRCRYPRWAEVGKIIFIASNAWGIWLLW